MEKPTNIRNIAIVASVHHGASTFISHLLGDDLEDEITTRIDFQLDKGDLPALKQTADGNQFLINIMLLSPRHIDFSAQLTPTLRVTDGAVVLVDCVEGVTSHTETILRIVLMECVRPVLVINNVDYALFELQATKEELYKSFQTTIDDFNAIISTYQHPTMGDVQVHPENNTVSFGSGGWSFTLRQFAARYAIEFGIDKENLMTKFWGDNFFDPITKEWTTKRTDAEGNQLQHGFCQFVLDPIFRMFHATMNFAHDTFSPMLREFDISLDLEDEISGTSLFNLAMGKFMPLDDSLLQMIVLGLPSPVTSQRYRVETLYEGPMDDESAIGIRHCDPNAPLVFYVSRMVPSTDKGRFYAFGRVFSGTVRPGSTIRIQGPNYIPRNTHDLFIKPVEGIVYMTRLVQNMGHCPAGNLVGIVGIDQYLLQNGTLTTSETAHNIKVIRFSVPPLVQVAVDVQNPADLIKLIEGLERLSKSDPRIQTWVAASSGEWIVASSSECHLENCLKDMGERYDVALKQSGPFVPYRETVTTESSIVASSKSPNKCSRLYVKASPLQQDLSLAIEEGQLDPTDETEARAGILANEYGWDPFDAKRIWCFGPESSGPNVLVNHTNGVARLDEIKDFCVSGFNWASMAGVLCEEPMRGVRFNILDVVLLRDTIHRGRGQIIPALRRVCFAASLLATPSLQQPIYEVEIHCPPSTIDNVYNALKQRQGTVFREEEQQGFPLLTIRAYLPVSESFGFEASLRSETSHQAFSYSVFHHWENMDGSPLEEGTEAEKLVRSIRQRKGLQETIPPLERYYDTTV